MSTIVLNSSINILPIFFDKREEKRPFQNVDGMKSQRYDDESKYHNNTLIQEEALSFQSSTTSQKITIFIDASNEARDLAKQIEHDLPNIPTKLLPPLDTTLRPSAILKALKKNVLACDVIIVPFQKNVPLEWLQERIRYYNKTHIYRDLNRPLYVNIFTQDQESPEHPISYSSRLHIRDCHHIQQCLKMEEK